MNVQNVNAFRQWYDAGYHELIPIVPPGATLSPRSHYSTQALGKQPGIPWDGGLWGALKGWPTIQVDADKIDEWGGYGASVGLRRGEVLTIDIDAMDPAQAEQIEAIAIDMLGPAPVRIGQAPKRALLYRTAAPLQFAKVRFQGASGQIEQVECPAQLVIDGVHAKTGRPYEWPRGRIPFDQLTLIAQEALDAFHERLRATLPGVNATEAPASIDRAKVDQTGLRGDPVLIERAVAAIPNKHDHFGYEEWVRIAAALRAALPEDQELGCRLFEEFSERTDLLAPEEDPARVYWSVNPPFALGADYLFDLAAKHSPTGSAIKAEIWLDPPGSDEPLFPENLPNAFGNSEGGDYFDVLTIEDLFNRPDPKFVIDRHLPEQSVGFLYGDPGTGKSFIALDWALHMAFRRPSWHGDAIDVKPGGAVIYLAGEGASGFKTRVAAWMLRHGIPEHERGRFVLLGASVNFMQPDDVRKLARTIKDRVACPVAMVVADTVSRSMPGADENLQKEMTLFVKACDVLRDAFECVVLGVHHAGKSGDMRGSTVLTGAGDFVFKLGRKKGAAIGTLHCEKQKDAPDGWDDRYRFDIIALGDGRSSLVPTRCDAGSVADGAVLTPDLSERVLAAMAAAWRGGRPWKLPRQARELMAARCMVRQFGFEIDAAEQLLATWLGMGLIREEVASRKSKMKGLFVVGENDESAAIDDASEEAEASVFD